MEKHIAGTSFTDNAPIIPIASLRRVLSKYLPHFFSQWFSSFISTLMFTPSLSLSLAGTALKEPEREQEDTVSLNTIDTAICQAPRASGRDALHAHLANWSTAGP